MQDYILKISSFFWNSSNHYLLCAFIIFYVYLTYKGLIGLFYNKKIKRQLNTLISEIPNEPVNSSCEFSRQDIIASGIQNTKNIILLNSTLNANGYDILSYEECFSICINPKYKKFFLYKCFFEDYKTYTNAYKKYKNIRQLLDLYKVDSFFALFSIIAILLIPTIWIPLKTNMSFPLSFITYLCVTLLTAIFIFFGYYNWKLQKTIKFLHNDKTMLWYVRYCFIKDMIEKSIEIYNREILEQKQKEEQQRKIIEEDKEQKKNDNIIIKKIRRNKNTNKKQQKSWLLIKDEVFERYGEICINCGATENIDVHHKIPLSEGGTNCLDNLIPLCRNCHEELHKFKLGQQNNTTINIDYGNKISKNKKSMIGYMICDAIEHGYRIKIRYKSGKIDNEMITERIIRPIEIKLGCECHNYNLIKKSEYDKYKKFIRAFCELRNEERLFRMDRIIDVIEEYKS